MTKTDVSIREMWKEASVEHCRYATLGRLGLDPRLARLFACAVGRIGPVRILPGVEEAAIELTEKVAEGDLPESALVANQERLKYPGNRYISLNPFVAAADAAHMKWAVSHGSQAYEVDSQARILAALVGEGMSFDPSWRSSHAVACAKGIYDYRDWRFTPILADALEDAGCNDEAVLSYLRGDGPFFRGCYVLDMVLGKRH